MKAVMIWGVLLMLAACGQEKAVPVHRSEEGTPLVIHNIGDGAQEEERLFDFPLTGHYRWFGK